MSQLVTESQLLKHVSISMTLHYGMTVFYVYFMYNFIMCTHRTRSIFCLCAVLIVYKNFHGKNKPPLTNVADKKEVDSRLRILLLSPRVSHAMFKYYTSLAADKIMGIFG